MNIFTTVFLVFVLSSCRDNKTIQSNERVYKLVATFRPAFDEASEIKFEGEDSVSNLSILIRKNFRIDETEDTFYFMSVPLEAKHTKLVHDAVLNRFSSTITQRKSTVLDGIKVNYQYTCNNDTALYMFHNPSKVTDSIAYELTSATLETCQTIFRDTVISDYFNDLRGYIDHKAYVEPTTMTPLKKMREMKYVGLMKYSR
jgi:hypothetical protein